MQKQPGKATRSVIELTGRQRQILQLIAEGKQNKEIADILGVSVKTVEFHRGVSLKEGANVELTVEAEPEDTTIKQ